VIWCLVLGVCWLVLLVLICACFWRGYCSDIVVVCLLVQCCVVICVAYMMVDTMCLCFVSECVGFMGSRLCYRVYCSGFGCVFGWRAGVDCFVGFMFCCLWWLCLV